MGASCLKEAYSGITGPELDVDVVNRIAGVGVYDLHVYHHFYASLFICDIITDILAGDVYNEYQSKYNFYEPPYTYSMGPPWSQPEEDKRNYQRIMCPGRYSP